MKELQRRKEYDHCNERNPHSDVSTDRFRHQRGSSRPIVERSSFNKSQISRRQRFRCSFGAGALLTTLVFFILTILNNFFSSSRHAHDWLSSSGPWTSVFIAFIKSWRNYQFSSKLFLKSEKVRRGREWSMRHAGYFFTPDFKGHWMSAMKYLWVDVVKHFWCRCPVKWRVKYH